MSGTAPRTHNFYVPQSPYIDHHDVSRSPNTQELGAFMTHKASAKKSRKRSRPHRVIPIATQDGSKQAKPTVFTAPVSHSDLSASVSHWKKATICPPHQTFGDDTAVAVPISKLPTKLPPPPSAPNCDIASARQLRGERMSSFSKMKGTLLENHYKNSEPVGCPLVDDKQVLMSALDCIENALQSRYDELKAEHDALKASYDKLKATTSREVLQVSHDALKIKYNALRASYDKLKATTSREVLQVSHDALKIKYNALKASHDELKAKHDNLVEDNTLLEYALDHEQQNNVALQQQHDQTLQQLRVLACNLNTLHQFAWQSTAAYSHDFDTIGNVSTDESDCDYDSPV